MWHYRLRLQHGWMPADPREAINYCGGRQLFDGSYAASATGNAASMQPTPSLAFPPAKISPSFDATLLPKYTATGSVNTLLHLHLRRRHTRPRLVHPPCSRGNRSPTAFVQIAVDKQQSTMPCLPERDGLQTCKPSRSRQQYSIDGGGPVVVFCLNHCIL
ncbi:hypothetical protein BDZ89DRAFT_143586 [Hymenopellis radicata]|nr:hypothetical protein BDZ89DRAFT_143586 [Hymenopellis radicata]